MSTVEVAMASMGGPDRRAVNNLYKQAMLEGAAVMESSGGNCQ